MGTVGAKDTGVKSLASMNIGGTSLVIKLFESGEVSVVHGKRDYVDDFRDVNHAKNWITYKFEPTKSEYDKLKEFLECLM